MQHEENDLVAAHLPCPDCGSSDARAQYSDGHEFCFACSARSGPTRRTKPSQKAADVPVTPVSSKQLVTGELRQLNARKLTLETVKAFNYLTGPRMQVAQFCDEAGNVVAQKIRRPDKTFAWHGEPKRAGLYGKQLWKGCDTKRLTITEGEIDAMTVYQVTRGQYPVVSVQNGAQSAAKSITADLEWIEGFDEVLICFDNDEPGIAAAKEVAVLLTPGKARIVELPLKDANDMLKEDRTAELYTALKSAKVYRPDGIVFGDELVASVLEEDPEADAQYPWEGLNAITRGLRFGELITVTAGIGTGKTSFLTEIVYALQRAGHRVGTMMLEESVKYTGRRLVGHHINKPLQVSREGIDRQQMLEAAQAVLGNNGVTLYDHAGELDVDNLLMKVRYMVKAQGVKFVVIDNLSAIAAGLDERDERKAIDKIMRSLWQLAQRENIVIFLAVHLKRIEGNKGHEDGVQTSLSHLRGSQSIASNSNMVIGLERDQQGEDKNLTTVRLLKNRLTGETGIAGHLRFDPVTGRLTESEAESPFTSQQQGGPREDNTDF